MTEKIYLDYQASTPCDVRVVETMIPYFTQVFGNPHSRSHSFGWEAEKVLEESRAKVAKSINTTPDTIIFTSGATESNNLAIKGLAEFWKGKKNHIITTEIEHKCVLEAVKHLERKENFHVTYLEVDKNGLVNPKDVENAITDQTLLVTISYVNHEIGAIQPIKEIGAICKKKNVFFHVDAAQAWGKIPIDVEADNIDLMSLSAHKIYGPKGVGALYLRCKPNRVRLKPLNSGGGQERGMRSGTTPVPLCVGMAKAAELFCTNKEGILAEYERVKGMHKALLAKLMPLSHIYLNGPDVDSGKRIPFNINISISGVEGEGLMMRVSDLAMSSGSACTSANLEPSYVLKALDIAEDLLHSSIRLSFGKDTPDNIVDIIGEKLTTAIVALREISPIWELLEEEMLAKK